MKFLGVRECGMITYCSRLIAENPQDKQDLLRVLELQRLAFNDISKLQFSQKKRSKRVLHSLSYRSVREKYPEMPAQVVIRTLNEVISSYRSIKSNKHKISKPAEKKKFSIRLDKRLYSKPKKDPYSIRITTTDKRKTFTISMYPKLKELMDSAPYCDPLIYERNGEIFISLTFDTAIQQEKQRLSLGVDLGIRVAAACSDGRLFVDRKFNNDKRKLRYLKRMLKSKGTKPAHHHLKKLVHSERNALKNQTHLLANAILLTDADTIALENLKGIKAKKHKFQNKNRISQVPLFELRRILTYKAVNMGKHVVLVSPAYTSQTDSVTGKREGERRGRRFYSMSGLIYDADLNAARNIGQRSKLPVSYGNILDGQGVVNRPIVCKSQSRKALGVTSS